MSGSVLSNTARSEARAVLQIAEHFVGFKERAVQFLSDFSANQRGYFTPTEDEQARQLLVSYWQARNALLELVTACRDGGEKELDADADVRFLAAFAGALVLIDAARLIRDEMHDRPVVRAKLNEPEPQFGIEAGCYDAIQKSLTSPAHAWHLYHAVEYYETNESALTRLADGEPLAKQLLDLVVRLRVRLDVVSPVSRLLAREYRRGGCGRSCGATLLDA